MRVYIEHEPSGLLLRGESQWVKGTEEARTFPTSLTAVEFCVRNGLRSVRLLLRGEGQPDFFVQPFGPLRKEMRHLTDANKRLQDQSRAEAADVENLAGRESQQSSRRVSL